MLRWLQKNEDSTNKILQPLSVPVHNKKSLTIGRTNEKKYDQKKEENSHTQSLNWIQEMLNGTMPNNQRSNIDESTPNTRCIREKSKYILNQKHGIPTSEYEERIYHFTDHKETAKNQQFMSPIVMPSNEAKYENKTIFNNMDNTGDPRKIRKKSSHRIGSSPSLRSFGKRKLDGIAIFSKSEVIDNSKIKHNSKIPRHAVVNMQHATVAETSKRSKREPPLRQPNQSEKYFLQNEDQNDVFPFSYNESSNFWNTENKRKFDKISEYSNFGGFGKRKYEVLSPISHFATAARNNYGSMKNTRKREMDSISYNSNFGGFGKRQYGPSNFKTSQLKHLHI